MSEGLGEHRPLARDVVSIEDQSRMSERQRVCDSAHYKRLHEKDVDFDRFVDSSWNAYTRKEGERLFLTAVLFRLIDEGKIRLSDEGTVQYGDTLPLTAPHGVGPKVGVESDARYAQELAQQEQADARYAQELAQQEQTDARVAEASSPNDFDNRVAQARARYEIDSGFRGEVHALMSGVGLTKDEALCLKANEGWQ